MNLRLTQGTTVLFDLPLPDLPLDPHAMVEPVFLADRDMERLCAFYSMGANQKRLRVMLELARGGELRFSDVMKIATNPKLAQDCLQPMLKVGLIVHGARGSGYRVSERALPLILTLTLGLARMLAILEQELAEDAKGAQP
jgi:hypothetical protein